MHFYALTKQETYHKIAAEINDNPDKKLNETLFKTYSNNLSTAVKNTVQGDEPDNQNFALQQRLTLNVNKFAAAKAYNATLELQDAVKDGDADQIKFVINKYNRYQAAEYQAATSRSRTAKQWQTFTGDNTRNRLFPNMKWLPSRSAEPRPEHEAFWNIVLPKNDSFWATNQPGNLWGCKCDWEETDDNPTHLAFNSPSVAATGLQGNPGITGQIFSNDASYFTKVIKKPEAEAAVQQVFYDDAKSNLKINVWADPQEIADNVRTGRILANNHKDMDISIAEHLPYIKNRSNPEYIINGMKADAKRIEQWNASDAFSSALKQSCDIVIVDLYKLHSAGKSINVQQLASSIVNRNADFISGKIKECYIVWGDKTLKIDNTFFSKYNINVRNSYIENMKNKITNELK